MRRRAFAGFALAAAAFGVAAAAASLTPNATRPPTPAATAFALTGTFDETFVGTRERDYTKSDAAARSCCDPYHDRFTVRDDATLVRAGDDARITDSLTLRPIGEIGEHPAPHFENRERIGRVTRQKAHTLFTIDSEESTMVRPGGTYAEFLPLVFKTTAIRYDRARTALVFDGSAETFSNGIARTIQVTRYPDMMTTRIGADGSVDEESHITPDLHTLKQTAGGSAQFESGMPGFSVYDLAVDPPSPSPDGDTIHVVRTSQGRNIDRSPATVESFSPHVWYPGGTLGPESDDVAANGIVSLPESCGHPLGARLAEATVERRSQTLATGDVNTESTTTYTLGEKVLCWIDDRETVEHDPTTGDILSTRSDAETLHLIAFKRDPSAA